MSSVRNSVRNPVNGRHANRHQRCRVVAGSLAASWDCQHRHSCRSPPSLPDFDVTVTVPILNQLRNWTIIGRVGRIMSSPRNEITGAQLDAAALTFDLLSVPGRLHLVWLLAGAELDVTTLAEATGAAIPATSQQLAKLRAAGVVTARRDGRRQVYRVEDPHILSTIEQMFSHIASDGTLATELDSARPQRRTQFKATSNA